MPDYPNGVATKTDVELVQVGLTGCRLAAAERHKHTMSEIAHVRDGLESLRADVNGVRSDIASINSKLDTSEGQRQAAVALAAAGMKAMPWIVKILIAIISAAALLSAGAGISQIIVRRNHEVPVRSQPAPSSQGEEAGSQELAPAAGPRAGAGADEACGHARH